MPLRSNQQSPYLASIFVWMLGVLFGVAGAACEHKIVNGMRATLRQRRNMIQRRFSFVIESLFAVETTFGLLKQCGNLFRRYRIRTAVGTNSTLMRVVLRSRASYRRFEPVTAKLFCSLQIKRSPTISSLSRLSVIASIPRTLHCSYFVFVLKVVKLAFSFSTRVILLIASVIATLDRRRIFLSPCAFTFACFFRIVVYPATIGCFSFFRMLVVILSRIRSIFFRIQSVSRSTLCFDSFSVFSQPFSRFRRVIDSECFRSHLDSARLYSHNLFRHRIEGFRLVFRGECLRQQAFASS